MPRFRLEGPYTMHELRNQHVSIGWFLGVLCTVKAKKAK